MYDEVSMHVRKTILAEFNDMAAMIHVKSG